MAILKVGDLVRRKVDGKPMVIVDGVRLRPGDWKCAWMEGHLRHTSEFTECEIERNEQRTIVSEPPTQYGPIKLCGPGVDLWRKS